MPLTRRWWASFKLYKTPLMIKPNNRALGAMGKQANLARSWKMHPFCLRHLSTGKRLTKFSVALWLPTNFVRLPPEEACHWIFGSLRFPTNPVPLPPRRGKSALRFPLESCSTLLSTHSAPCIGGKVVAPATKGGAAFPSPVRTVVWFSNEQSEFGLFSFGR